MKFLFILDLFKKPVNFKVNSEKSYSSFIGLIISVLSILLSVTLSMGTISDYWNLSNPKISRKTSESFRKIPLYGNQTGILFKYIALNLSLLQIKILPFKDLIYPDLLQLKSENGILMYEKIFEKSGSLKPHGDENAEFMFNSSLYLENSIIHDVNSTRYAFIFKSKDFINLTQDNPSQSYLFEIESLQNRLNTSDYSSPVVRERIQTRFPISVDEINVYTVSFLSENYVFNYPYISRLLKKDLNFFSMDSYFRISSTRMDTKNNSQGIMMGILLEHSKSYIITQIDYVNEEDLFSQLGGTFGAVFTFLGIIYNSIIGVSLTKCYLNSFYSFYSTNSLTNSDLRSTSTKHTMIRLLNISYNESDSVVLSEINKLKQVSRTPYLVSFTDALMINIGKINKCLNTRKSRLLAHFEEKTQKYLDLVLVSKAAREFEVMKETMIDKSNLRDYLASYEINIENDETYYKNDITPSLFSDQQQFDSNQTCNTFMSRLNRKLWMNLALSKIS